MPKARKPQNRGLPARWCLRHGAYYFQVPPGLEQYWDGKKLFRLGSSLPAAYAIWAERIGATNKASNFNQLFDRYAIEVIPIKAPKTQLNNNYQLKTLRAVFGEMPLLGIQPTDIYKYYDKRGANVAAKREVELLRHSLTKAVEWGYIARHPFKGEVRLQGDVPRDRYVEDWEVIAALSMPPLRRGSDATLVVQAYLRIKLLTGMARSDLLRLRPQEHFKDDGIHIQRHKTARSTGKRTIYEWTPELRASVQRALDARPVDISPFLFCTRRGAGYFNEETGEAPGWNSIWQRFIKRVIADTEVESRFTEHDLRAKVGSDADDLEHARKLLSHADSRTTQRAYRRKPDRVRNSTKGNL